MTNRHRLTTLGQWVLLGTLVGVVCGAASALFLWSLEQVTAFRVAHAPIVWALPLAGLALGWVLDRYGKSVRAGQGLIIDTIHDGGPELPLRMAPLVLGGTLVTHLFGGSAGREGTAVQMGASLTDWLSHRLGVGPRTRRSLLAAGVAGGFGSVFGTPLAGAVFGLEFVVLGRIEYEALLPALLAAVVGDLVTRGLGVAHSAYPVVAGLPLTPLLLGKWALFAAAVAGTTTLFIDLTHALKRHGARWLPSSPLRLAAGGAAVVALWQLSGTDDFLGLGVPTILRAYTDASLPPATFLLKLLFTAVTVGLGFVGGEVTPLFFVGATLGNLLARALGLPLDLGAAVGMSAVFAAAANTPLALSLMAVELVGAGVFPHAAIVCVLAWLLTGHRGIYPAQRLVRGKEGTPLERPTRLDALPSPPEQRP